MHGSQNNADSLSRLTTIERSKRNNVAEDYICFTAQSTAPKAMTSEEIETESANDSELEELRECIKTGDWENPKCVRYKPVRNELCVLGNIVLRGTRLVIPLKLRRRVLELGHEGHLGIVQMK